MIANTNVYVKYLICLDILADKIFSNRYTNCLQNTKNTSSLARPFLVNMWRGVVTFKCLSMLHIVFYWVAL